MSITYDSRITAKLSFALRAARVKNRCPSKACVRAGKSVEGFRSTRNPSTSPHKAAGIRVPGGDASLAGACEGEHSFPESGIPHAKRPKAFPYRREGGPRQRWMRCQHRRRTWLIPLSDTSPRSGRHPFLWRRWASPRRRLKRGAFVPGRASINRQEFRIDAVDHRQIIGIIRRRHLLRIPFIQLFHVIGVF